MYLATLGGGCFWCLEAVFQQVEGVSRVVSGYTGGEMPNPDYHSVCTGTTGHAEVVQITFDPNKVTYSHLLDLFFKAHDPTTLNRQGADVGTQYRSAIFYHNEDQLMDAQDAKMRANTIWDAPIVTEITKLDTFYPAEDLHQNYYQDHKEAAYCRVVIRPKLEKLGMDT